jgi:hypothetical protein
MKLGKATLIKLRTADGLWSILDRVGIGKQYVVDLDSIQRVECTHIPTGKDHVAMMINTQEENGSWSPFPIELLELYDNQGTIYRADKADVPKQARLAG